jgi:hypothetical protein
VRGARERGANENENENEGGKNRLPHVAELICYGEGDSVFPKPAGGIMRDLKKRALTFIVPALFVPCLVIACSGGSSSNPNEIQLDDASPSKPDRSMNQGADTGGNNDFDAGSKPRPSAMDASTRDAMPDTRPDASKPKTGGDGGKLTDAGLGPDAMPPVTGTGSPLDPVDESLMPDYGLDEGLCTDYQLTKDTGRCYNGPFSGTDYVEGCVSPDTYLLDCSRYETAGMTRSICQDDGTLAGCILLDVAQVASFEGSQTDQFLDQSHKCPDSWNGYAYCQGDFISLCNQGEDVWLDCSIYNFDTFTYTCGTDTDGHIACL